MFQNTFKFDPSALSSKPTFPQIRKEVVRALESDFRAALGCKEYEDVYRVLREAPTGESEELLHSLIARGVLSIADKSKETIPPGDVILRRGSAVYRLISDHILKRTEAEERDWRHDGGIKQLLAFYREETPLMDTEIRACLRTLEDLFESSRQKGPQSQNAPEQQILDGIHTSPAISMIVDLLAKYPQTFGRSNESFIDALTQITRLPSEMRVAVNKALGEQVQFYIERYHSSDL